MNLTQLIEAAAGRTTADLILKNGRIINVWTGEILEGDIAILSDRIAGIGQYSQAHEIVDLEGRYVSPGFIDAHIHIESSMLSAPEFAKVVCPHGTSAVFADPHEIANVMGIAGIEYMLETSRSVPLDVFLMASSCVPASHFETAGAALSADDLKPLFNDSRVVGLAEMMNYPGVVAGDPDCLSKIQMASGRVVDGHAPGLTGRDLCAYVAAGIRSDHECTTLEEAQEKLRMGMHIMIREGSQAKNLDALLPLVTPENIDRIMLVTDDKDVDDLLAEGHVDHLVRRAINGGLSPIQALRMVTINPAKYFSLTEFGVIAPGKIASLTILDDLTTCQVQRVYHKGQLVAVDGHMAEEAGGRETSKESVTKPTALPNSVHLHDLNKTEFEIKAPQTEKCSVHVIEVTEGRIDTDHSIQEVPIENGRIQTNVQQDLLKIAVIERHNAIGNIGLAFVHGFGFKTGAIGSSVGHDSHNLVVVGTNDDDLYAAAKHLEKIHGGFCVVNDGKVLADVPLPIAGLMSDQKAETLSTELQALHKAAESLGGKLRRPFMALSFLSLSVIGKLKVTDQGLIDVDRFERINVVEM